MQETQHIARRKGPPLAACILFSTLTVTQSAMAGQAVGDVQPDTALDSSTFSNGTGFFRDSSFLVVPVPISNPTVGSGLGLAGALLFKTDEKSSSSFIGVAGFGTNNGSWGAGTAASVVFDEDRYRAKASAGYASVSYDFYGIGVLAGHTGRHVSLTQSGYLFQSLFQARVVPNFYLGGQARYMSIKTAFDLPAVAGNLPSNGGLISNTKDTVTTIGPVATYDTRDKDYSPSSGELVEAKFDLGLQNFSRRNSFERATLTYSRYDALADNLVLASHGSLCAVDGKVPIFDLCLFGSSNDLRGYPVGKFQDRSMFATQVELRWLAFWRIGFVAFGGIGSVAPSMGKFKDILASGGGGMRFLASKEYGINVGIDGAVTKDGEKAFYIQVGEAF